MKSIDDDKGVQHFASPDEFEAYMTESNLHDTNAAKQAKKAKR
jgi:hypothetical protein